MTFSIAIFSKSNPFKKVEYIETFDAFLKYTPNYDEIYSIIQGGDLSYHQARYIKDSYGGII